MPQAKPLDLFWFIPVSGDGSYLGTTEGHRPADFGYLKQIAEAADRLGYTGVLIPTGKNCDDPWITAAALIPATERLREYQDLGISTIIASGYPHLEEAYKVAELLFPVLRIGRAPKGAHGAQVGEFGVSGTGLRLAASAS